MFQLSPRSPQSHSSFHHQTSSFDFCYCDAQAPLLLPLLLLLSRKIMQMLSVLTVKLLIQHNSSTLSNLHLVFMFLIAISIQVQY